MKTYKFKIIKKKEGKESQKPSFTLSLTMKPNNIKSVNPPEEINKILSNIRPISIPIPPKSSNTPVNFVNFSNPNRLNSFCILGDSNRRLP